jgi:tetratricopeptide (TPR) repeat protein
VGVPLAVVAIWAAWAWLAPLPDLGHAIALANSGRFDEAESLARDYLRRDPDSPRAHMLAAQFAIQRPTAPPADGELLDPEPALRALEHLDRIQTVDRELSALVALYRGKAQYRLGRLVEAESSWEEAIRLNLKIPEAGWHLLELYYLQGRSPASRRLALRMHEVEPDPRDQVQYLLELLRQEAQPPAPESLIRVFEPIVRQNPDDFRANIALGLALERSGRVEPGLEALRDAVRTRPDQPDAWEAWLTGLEEAGQVDALSLAWDRLPVELSGSPRFARFAARIAQERGDAEAAIDLYRRALGADPRDRTLAFRLARALRNAGRTDEADRIDRNLLIAQEAALGVPSLYQELNATPSLSLSPHAELYRRAADLRERMGALEESLAWHRLVLRDRPDDAESRAALERLSTAIQAREGSGPHLDAALAPVATGPSRATTGRPPQVR